MACEVICCEDNDILDIIVYGTIDVKHDDNTNNNSNNITNITKMMNINTYQNNNNHHPRPLQ